MSEKAAPSHHHHQHQQQDDVDEETATLPYKAEEEQASAVMAGTTPADARSDEDEAPSSSSSSPATGWPHTFERSIALLASPILPAADAAFYSKSPAPGGLNLLLRRGGDLDRGIHTPVQLYGSTTNGRAERTMMGAAAVDSHSERDLLLNGRRPALMARTPSLNLHQQIQSAAIMTMLDVEQEHEKRQLEAKSYRQKLLQKKNKMNNKPQKGQPKKNRVVEKCQHKQRGGEQHHEKASVLQCIFNLSNILMGVGLLGLPYVFRLTGYGGGVICILVLATICWRTAILIGRCLGNSSHPCDDSKILTSFPDIARAAFGEMGCYVLSTILYFELFSCVSIFFVSMGDHLHTLIPAVSAATHMMLVSLVSMVPTIFLRTPALLSYLSMVGTVATIAVVLTVVSAGLLEGDVVDHDAAATAAGLTTESTVTATDAVPIPPSSSSSSQHHCNWDANGLPLAFGLVVFCFSGHAIVPNIYTSMQEPHRFDYMVSVTFAIVAVCSLAVGSAGYYMFGDTVADQVTLSLEQHSQATTAMTALTWLMVLTAFSKVTLTMFPLALGFEEIFTPYLATEGMVNVLSGGIKLVLTLLALLVSLYVPSFSYLCALVGIVCTMTVSVIFPALAHLKLFAGKGLPFHERLADYMLITMGLFMAVYGTFVHSA